MKGVALISAVVASAILLYAEPRNTSYQYDALSRLVRASYSDGTVIEYTYDAAGNRTRKVVTTANGAASTTGTVRAAVGTPSASTTTVNRAVATPATATNSAPKASAASK